MPLTIHKLTTRCRAPRRYESVARSADRAARTRLAAELSRTVTSRPSARPRVLRIRRLHVKLAINPRMMDEDLLAPAWAAEIQKQLARAIDLAAHGSSDVVIADNPAEFRATFIRDLLTGRAGGRWEYAEFEDLASLPAIEAALSLLLRFPDDLVPTLKILDRSDAFPRLLRRLDDASLDRLFVAVAGTTPPETIAPGSLNLPELLRIAELALQSPKIPGIPIDSRAAALAIYIRHGDGRLPRGIFHGLLILCCLLECPDLLDRDSPESPASPEFFQHRTGRWLPTAVTTTLVELRRNLKRDRTAASEHLVAQLLHLLEKLRPLLPTAAPAGTKSQRPWRHLDSAGLLLLTNTIHRLGWDRLRDDPILSPWGGPRLFQILLIGIGSASLGKPTADFHSVDPAASFFAGLTEDLDLPGIRHMLSHIGIIGRGLLLNRLGVPGDAAQDWNATFKALAEILVLNFAAQIPGFRQAGPGAVARQFFVNSGRVQITDTLVTVLLDSSPFHVALRIAALDSPIARVPWMNGRRMEFRLLGL